MRAQVPIARHGSRAATGGIALLAAAALLFAPCALKAGPPFFSDDPDVIDFRHWEMYLATQDFFTRDGAAGTAPHVETNYGAAHETMVHLIVPVAYSKPSGLPTQMGPGDIEVGAQYRFVDETRRRPMIGLFPHLEIPTGSSRRGLGNGRAQAFLPLWAQKSWGPWTTFGGGGYWINPGAGHSNFWMFGWVATRDFTENFTAGLEVIHNTPDEVGGESETGLDLGALLTLREGHVIMFSGGRDIHGPNRFYMYAAYYRTWGPRGRH
jgi:hypothetical protein